MQVLLLIISNVFLCGKSGPTKYQSIKYVNKKWCEVLYELPHIFKHIYAKPLRVIMTRLLRELINCIIFAHMSKIMSKI